MPIQGLMMRGGSNIRRIIADHLEANVPAAIDIMIAQNDDLNSLNLPYPKMYDATDPTHTDKYPYMGAFVTGSDNYERKDVEPSGALEIEPSYEVTFFVTATTAHLGVDAAGLPKYEKEYRHSSLRMRDDLMSILLQVLMSEPSLGTAGSKYRALLDEGSIRTSYPEPLQKSNNQPVWICNGLVLANVKLVETTVVPHLGNANTLTPSVSILIP